MLKHPQPKLGPSCNSSRSDDFLYGGGVVRTPTAYRCLPRLAYRLTVRLEYYSTLAPNESVIIIRGKGLSSVDSYENP